MPPADQQSGAFGTGALGVRNPGGELDGVAGATVGPSVGRRHEERAVQYQRTHIPFVDMFVEIGAGGGIAGQDLGVAVPVSTEYPL